MDTANTNRLATVKQGTTTLRAFTYDAAGNMTQDTRGTTQYNYTISAAGRIARVAIGTSVRADYTYDGKSRLASHVTQNQAGAGKVSFSGLCCAKPVPTFAAKPVERLFHDNDNRVIAEVNATGTTVREYIWLDDLPVAVLDGSTSTTNPALFFVHADHLNRPVAMSNAAKAWVWRAQYEPFGAVHQIVGPAANDQRFPGQWFQLEAGLAYNWHRHYDATLGRYTQPDPLGLQTLLSDGPSVYGYAKQKPMELTDPLGLEVNLCCRPAEILGGRSITVGLRLTQSQVEWGQTPILHPVNSMNSMERQYSLMIIVAIRLLSVGLRKMSASLALIKSLKLANHWADLPHYLILFKLLRMTFSKSVEFVRMIQGGIGRELEINMRKKFQISIGLTVILFGMFLSYKYIEFSWISSFYEEEKKNIYKHIAVLYLVFGLSVALNGFSILFLSKKKALSGTLSEENRVVADGEGG